jgi:hypothetical protein
MVFECICYDTYKTINFHACGDLMNCLMVEGSFHFIKFARIKLFDLTSFDKTIHNKITKVCCIFRIV